MIITFIIAVVIATIILGVNPRNPSLRWLSACFYAGSSSIMVFLLDLEFPDAPHVLINSMFFVSDMAVAFTFGMFGVVSSGLISSKNRKRLIATGMLLIGIVLLLTPLASTRRINYEGYNELPVVLLVALSLTLGAVLLIIASVREKHPYKKIERLLTNLFMVPTMLCYAGSYVLYIIEIDLFQYNYFFAIGFVVLFLLIGVKQGALGVKIKIEMLKADASLHVLNGGTSLLNHTIKNEVGKIDLLLHQMKHSLLNNDEARKSTHNELEDMLTLATESVHHIQTMMAKINDRIQTIEVNLKKENILHVVVECLERFEKINGYEVTIKRSFEPVPEVYHDPIHMKEVLQNILMNAVESMDYRGQIKVNLTETASEVILQMQDSGKGITKEALPTIFEPFYSTKNMKNHYGLGLFYCKNVMMKHNGSIHAESIQGKGSSFFIHLKK